MSNTILTNFGNLSYTAQRAVGYDLKGSFCVFWKIGTKEAEKICKNMGVPFSMSINRESVISECHRPKFRELESRGIVKLRVR